MKKNASRRYTIKSVGIFLALTWIPFKSFANRWNKTAFNADQLDNSIELIGAEYLIQSDEVEIKVPQIAENGTIVPVEIYSHIIKTNAIYIFVGKNPSPLTAKFLFSDTSYPFVSTRIKMRESSELLVVVETKEKKFYANRRMVKVTIGGCGEET